MMISFHFPPIAASAAVSGQSFTGLGLRARRVVTSRFLLVAKTSSSLRCLERRRPLQESAIGRAAMTRHLLCGVALLLQPFQPPAPPDPPAAPTLVQATPAQNDGQHDFDFEVGAWKVRLSRLEQPLRGSTTWRDYEGSRWFGRSGTGAPTLASSRSRDPPVTSRA